jgi:hypothetical protein
VDDLVKISGEVKKDHWQKQMLLEVVKSSEFEEPHETGSIKIMVGGVEVETHTNNQKEIMKITKRIELHKKNDNNKKGYHIDV